MAERGGIPEEGARAAIARGGAFVQGVRVRDAARAIHPGERVEVELRAPPAPAPLEAGRIVYRDPALIAVDKPAGVAAQEAREGGPSLPDLVSALLKTLGEPEPALLVHRLDRGTTGLCLLARTKDAQRELLDQFRAHRVVKEYRALVAGAPREDEFVVDAPLGADPRGAGLRRVDPAGEPARTRVRVLERFGAGGALVAAFPETGRTHQIRVHLREAGAPLFGDVRYGGPPFAAREGGRRLELGRPLLHALALSLHHPDGSALSLRAPEPADFLEALRFLR